MEQFHFTLGDRELENCNTGTLHQSHNFSDDIKVNYTEQQTSPRKDTAVQTGTYLKEDSRTVYL